MLFDTSIVIDMMRKRRPYQYGSISTITLIEFVRGVYEEEMAVKLVLLKQSFKVYDIDDEVVLAYSRMYRALKRSKKTMADADLIIAATAFAKNEKLGVNDSDFDLLEDVVDLVKG